MEHGLNTKYNYQWVLFYEDHLTKYILVKPLKHKHVKKFAIYYLIFLLNLTVRVSYKVESNNGRGLDNKFIV